MEKEAFGGKSCHCLAMRAARWGSSYEKACVPETLCPISPFWAVVEVIYINLKDRELGLHTLWKWDLANGNRKSGIGIWWSNYHRFLSIYICIYIKFAE